MSEAMDGPVWCKRAQVSSQWHAFECGPVQFTLVQEKKSRLGEISKHLVCGDLSPMATWQCLNQCLAPRSPHPNPAPAPAASTVPGPAPVPGECLEMPVAVQGIKRRDFLHMSHKSHAKNFRRKGSCRAILVTARATDRLTRGSQACAVRRLASSGDGPGDPEPGGNSEGQHHRQTGGNTEPMPWTQRLGESDPDTGSGGFDLFCMRQPELEGSLSQVDSPRPCPEPTATSGLHCVSPGDVGGPVVRQRLGREWKQPGLGLGVGQRPRQGPGGMRVRAHSAFPGVPWVQVSVEQRTTHSLSSVPHSTSCFLIPQTLSSPLKSAGPRVTSAQAGSGADVDTAGPLHQAYCVGIDTWRPVLQLQFPPAAQKASSSSRFRPAGSTAPEPSPSVFSRLRQEAATVWSPVLGLSTQLLGPAAEALISRYQARRNEHPGLGDGAQGGGGSMAFVYGYQARSEGSGAGEVEEESEPQVCERPLKTLCVPRRARRPFLSSGRAFPSHRQNARQNLKHHGKLRRGGAPSRDQGARDILSEGGAHAPGGGHQGLGLGRQAEGGVGVEQVGGFVREIAPAASDRVHQLWRRLCKPFASLLQKRPPQDSRGAQGSQPPLHPLASRLSSSSAASLTASHFLGGQGSPHAAALHLERLLQTLRVILRGMSQSQGAVFAAQTWRTLSQSHGVVVAARMREIALRGEMAVARLAGPVGMVSKLAGLEGLVVEGRMGGGQVAPAFSAPVHGGWLSSRYGWRGKRFHHGIDIAVEENTDVTAAAPGTVTYVGWRGGYGKVVHLDHGNGFTTLYAHCNRFFVKAGQVVQGSDRIALSGNTGRSTGPHLHFEIQRHGGTLNPLWLLPRSYVRRLLPQR